MATHVGEFQSLIEEVEAIRHLADSGRFITSASATRLEVLQQEIERAQVSAHPDHPWPIGITKDSPVETAQSVEYGRGNGALGAVIGRLSAIWHIRPTGLRRRHKYQQFAVDTAAGPAATRVSICSVADGVCSELASWHSDIRAEHAPGCFFHLQVLGERHDTPFPRQLDIPRFPDPFTTPMATLEFLLSELFPARWARHLEDSPYRAGQWRTTQLQYWRQRLDDQRQLMSDALVGSPWLAIKRWPDAD